MADDKAEAGRSSGKKWRSAKDFVPHFVTSDATTVLELLKGPDVELYGSLDEDESDTDTLVFRDSCTVHLKVTLQEGQHVSVQDNDVPILVFPRETVLHHPWDLTTEQILHHVDGTSHVVKIAAEADVDINLVKACLQNLLYFNVIKMVSVFRYSNVYTCTPDIHKLFSDKKLQEECLHYVARNEHSTPAFRDVFMLYCSFSPGITLKDICVRFNPHSLKIDEKCLIQFGLLKGLIRRMQRYPVKLPNESSDMSPRLQPIVKWLGGNHSYDEISCKTGLSHLELEELIEKDPTCVVCWK